MYYIGYIFYIIIIGLSLISFILNIIKMNKDMVLHSKIDYIFDHYDGKITKKHVFIPATHTPYFPGLDRKPGYDDDKGKKWLTYFIELDDMFLLRKHSECTKVYAKKRPTSPSYDIVVFGEWDAYIGRKQLGKDGNKFRKLIENEYERLKNIPVKLPTTS
jgi:hypothetical protein